MDFLWCLLGVLPFLGLLAAAMGEPKQDYPPKGGIADFIYSVMGEKPRKDR